MKRPERYLVTAALPYANGPLHIGHIAGAYLPADIYVRYLRQKGEDVAFICGSDEHGAAITMQAKKEGVEPREIVNKYHTINKKAFEGLGIDFDIYHRTSSELHYETAQDFFRKLEQQGSLTKRTGQQYYDEEEDQFLADRYIQGTCPKCGHDEAYGDQCEKCGSSLSPNELIDPVSMLSGKKPVWRETTHWYLPMGRHEDWLRAYIKNGELDGKAHHDPATWKEHVKGQCLSWIDGGLKERAMTRDLDWGVPVPVEDNEGKVLYVWLDAPIGYISATKQWAADQGKNWARYWKDENTQLVCFIGKDNIVFHAIIFPIILKEYNEGFLLPHNIPANGFLNLEGGKLSTSRNWAVWVNDYLEDFPDKIDVLRYTLTSISPENRDSEFTWEDFQRKNNNELVGVLGNFVNRALVLTQKHFEGAVPERGPLTTPEKELIDVMEQAPGKIGGLIEEYRLKEAQMEVMKLARAGNKYLADTEPWKTVKEDRDRTATILNMSLQVTANLAILLYPFLPFTSERMRTTLGLLGPDLQLVGDHDLLSAGHPIQKTGHLFDKIGDETIRAQVEKLKTQSQEKTQEASSQAQQEKDENPLAGIEDFKKLDIRIGKIENAEKVSNTKKLLKLTVSIGPEHRTIVAGLAEQFKPDDLPGKHVTILVNLEPRKIKGIESQGMLLMAENDQGRAAFLEPHPTLESGSRIQ